MLELGVRQQEMVSSSPVQGIDGVMQNKLPWRRPEQLAELIARAEQQVAEIEARAASDALLT